MRGFGIKIVTRSVEIDRQQKDRIETILHTVGMGLLIMGDVGAL